MELYDVVKKLVGEINPVGETDEDSRRFENLKTLTELVDGLLIDIDYVARKRHRHEYSIKLAGDFASKFLDNHGIKE